MADRSHRGIRAAVVVGMVACLVGCTTTATRSGVGESPPVRVLQLNLCGSGIAVCYTGRSTAEAAAVIRAETPDLITLNEVCRDDVTTLERALADVAPGGVAVSAFQAARDGPTGEAYRCRDGEQYGIGIVSRWSSVPGSSAGGGIYSTQDGEDPEQRAWLCLDVAGPDVAATPAVAVCTTHLAYTKREVAVAQCRYLFDTVIAERRAPLVLGGDLNLGAGDRSCLPAGSVLVDDGGVQHVVATPEFVVEDSRTIDLRGTTDHPGLLVTLGSRRAGSRCSIAKRNAVRGIARRALPGDPPPVQVGEEPLGERCLIQCVQPSRHRWRFHE